MSITGPGPRLCERWTRLYSRGLSDAVATQRRAEIASDLWEHADDATRSGQGRLGFNMAVIGRVIGGIAADLAWRRRTLRAQPDTSSTFDRFAGASEQLVVVLAAIGMAPSLMLVQLLVTQSLSILGLLWIVVAVAMAGMLLAGLVLRSRDRRPVLSTVLLVLGCPAPSFAVFWLPPVYLLSVAIAMTAIASMPRTSSSLPT